MPAKKTTKKVAAKKAAAKKAAPQSKTAAKTAAKKTAVKKTAAKKTAPKEVAAKKTAAKKESSAAPAKKAVSAKKAAPVKMTAFIKKQQQKLLDLRDDLMEALHGVQSEAIKAASEGADTGNGQHQGDAGSDSYDRDLALSMLEKEKDALHEVEAALERIEAGVYGLDEMNGEKIPQERLEVLPFARLTIANQERWEAEQRTRGVHPGDYGFGAFGESSKSVSLDASDD
jgi:RNA polymerase-binding transcription factor DksA